MCSNTRGPRSQGPRRVLVKAERTYDSVNALGRPGSGGALRNFSRPRTRDDRVLRCSFNIPSIVSNCAKYPRMNACTSTCARSPDRKMPKTTNASPIADAAEDDLEHEIRLSPLDEVAEARSELRLRERSFHGQPRPATAKHDEVDLETSPVAEVAKLKFLAFDVDRPVHGAQQVEREHVLEAGALRCAPGPVPTVQLLLLFDRLDSRSSVG